MSKNYDLAGLRDLFWDMLNVAATQSNGNIDSGSSATGREVCEYFVDMKWLQKSTFPDQPTQYVVIKPGCLCEAKEYLDGVVDRIDDALNPFGAVRGKGAPDG